MKNLFPLDCCIEMCIKWCQVSLVKAMKVIDMIRFHIIKAFFYCLSFLQFAKSIIIYTKKAHNLIMFQLEHTQCTCLFTNISVIIGVLDNGEIQMNFLGDHNTFVISCVILFLFFCLVILLYIFSYFLVYSIC